MKFLIDAQLPLTLARWLRGLGSLWSAATFRRFPLARHGALIQSGDMSPHSMAAPLRADLGVEVFGGADDAIYGVFRDDISATAATLDGDFGKMEGAGDVA